MIFWPLRWFAAAARLGLALLPSPPRPTERPARATPTSAVRVAAEPTVAPAPDDHALAEGNTAPPAVASVDAIDVPPVLAQAVRVAFDATVAALDPSVVDLDECARRDAEAERRAAELARYVAETDPDLPTVARERVGAIADRVANAQLQIMAFAINRKNRGEADAAETEAEARGRASFRHDVEPMVRALRANA